MDEEFDSELFISLVISDFNKMIREEFESNFIFLKDLFGDIYYHSNNAPNDKRKKIKDLLLSVEGNLDENREEFRKRFSLESLNEFDKFLNQISSRNDHIFGFIWTSGDIRNTSEKILESLKKFQLEKHSSFNVPYAIDYSKVSLQ